MMRTYKTMIENRTVRRPHARKMTCTVVSKITQTMEKGEYLIRMKLGRFDVTETICQETANLVRCQLVMTVRDRYDIQYSSLHSSHTTQRSCLSVHFVATTS